MRHYRFGQGKWVFIDWMGIDPGYGSAWRGKISDGYCMPEGIRLQVHQPTLDYTPVLAADPGNPHEQLGIGFANFLYDQGRFRCWYTAMSRSGNPRWPVLMRQCHAESDDGVTWRKPKFHLREFAGSRDNNLILGPEGYVFVDPSADADQRYKMVAPGGKAGVLGAVSADGLHFTQLPQPILPGNNSDTDDVGWYNPRTNQYVIYTRQADGRMQRRGVNRSASADFTHFPPSTPVIEANPLDPPDWDYYCNGFLPWPGAEAAYVMQLAVYEHHTDVVKVHLAVSRDEVLWHRPMGRTPWVDADGHRPRFPSLYPCGGVLTTGSGDAREWSLYFHLDHLAHNELEAKFAECQPYLIRGTLRPDGFMSLTADGHGQCWTVPFTLASDELALNYRTRYSGYVKGELIETPVVGAAGHSVTEGTPIPGFTLADADPLTGDALQQPLSWRGQTSLAHLRGREVRLRLSLFKAELYALHF